MEGNSGSGPSSNPNNGSGNSGSSGGQGGPGGPGPGGPGPGGPQTTHGYDPESERKRLLQNYKKTPVNNKDIGPTPTERDKINMLKITRQQDVERVTQTLHNILQETER
ncbi:MAG: hypothetical protein EOP34_04335 [Rickettsiales bacterium]|nr:MAG: hypothetical protein EOP34_04335 [Rickettsiales bacterium]